MVGFGRPAVAVVSLVIVFSRSVLVALVSLALFFVVFVVDPGRCAETGAKKSGARKYLPQALRPVCCGPSSLRKQEMHSAIKLNMAAFWTPLRLHYWRISSFASLRRPTWVPGSHPSPQADSSGGSPLYKALWSYDLVLYDFAFHLALLDLVADRSTSEDYPHLSNLSGSSLGGSLV